LFFNIFQGYIIQKMIGIVMKNWFLFVVLFSFSSNTNAATVEEGDAPANKVAPPVRADFEITGEESFKFAEYIGTRTDTLRKNYLLHQMLPTLIQEIQRRHNSGESFDTITFPNPLKEDAILTAESILKTHLIDVIATVVDVLPVRSLADKSSYTKVHETNQLVILQKMTAVLVSFLEGKENNSKAGQALIKEREGVEQWLIYVRAKNGYLPMLWDIPTRKTKSRFLTQKGPYRILDSRLQVGFDAAGIDRTVFFIIWDLERRQLVKNQGIALTLTPVDEGWRESMDSYRGTCDARLLEGYTLASTVEGASVGQRVLGELYPKFNPIPRGFEDHAKQQWVKDHTHTYFIPFPASAMDHARIYHWAIEGLMKEYESTEGDAKTLAFDTLCFLGSAHRLLKPEAPEGTPKKAWRQKQANLKKKIDKKNASRLQDTDSVLASTTTFEGVTDADIEEWRLLVSFIKETIKALVKDPSEGVFSELRSAIKDGVGGIVVGVKWSRPEVIVTAAIKTLVLSEEKKILTYVPVSV
jgi:hypothetical protein